MKHIKVVTRGNPAPGQLDEITTILNIASAVVGIVAVVKEHIIPAAGRPIIVKNFEAAS